MKIGIIGLGIIGDIWSGHFEEAGMLAGTWNRTAKPDAPQWMETPDAEVKQTVFYLGGDAELIAELKPLFDVVSSAQFHIGNNEQACALKLAMNLNISAQMQALCEALTIVRRAGVSDDVFFDALGKNASCSGVTKLKEPKLRAADYSPQFSVKHMLKDMRLASRINGCEDFPGSGIPALQLEEYHSHILVPGRPARG